MSRRAVITAALVVALLAGGVWLWHWRQGGDEVTGVAGEAVLSRAMTGLDGEPVTLRDWSGKTRLVNFWATWCAPCRVEMPWFQEAYERFGERGFAVIGVALDDAAAVRQFADKLGITYPLPVVDADTGSRMMRDFANPAGVVPHSILLSPDGRILAQHIGPFEQAQLTELLETHVK